MAKKRARKVAIKKPPSYQRMHLHIGKSNVDIYDSLISYCEKKEVNPTPIIWEAVDKFLKSKRKRK